MNEEKYVTSDLYLTAYLKTKGFKFNLKEEYKKTKFEFDKRGCCGYEYRILVSQVSRWMIALGSCVSF